MEACQLAGCSREQLLGPQRHQPLSSIRHMAMLIIYEHTAATYAQIAKAFGRSDHTTAISGVATARIRLMEGRRSAINAYHSLYFAAGRPTVVRSAAGVGTTRTRRKAREN